MLEKYFKILEKLQPILAPAPRPAVICLTCGRQTIQDQKCCGQPVQIKTNIISNTNLGVSSCNH